MRKQLLSLFNDSIIYGLSGVISSFISIFLIPLYTRVFQPADYGVISILTTTSALLNILLVFSLDNSAAVWFWDKTDEEDRKKTFNSWLGFLFGAGIITATIIIFFSRTLSQLFFNTNDHTTLFLLLGANLLFVGFQKVVNIWCRMLRKPVKAMLFSLIVLLITIGLNILFILIWKIGISGVFYSQLIASISGFFIMFILFRNWINLRFFSRERLKKMIRFSAPLVPATVMYWLMNTASIYFLKIYVNDNEEIGLYQVGASVANILSICTWAFFQAWAPFALSVSKQSNAKRIYSFVFELYCVGGFYVAFSLILMSQDILTIFTHSNYFGAATVLGLLAVNVVLIGMPNILVIANSLTKKNTSYAIAISLGSAITVILFMSLIPEYGKEGAAMAMIAGNLVIPIFMGFRVQKLYYVPYKFLRITLIVLLQLGVIIIARKFMTTMLDHIITVVALGVLIAGIYYQTAKKSGLDLASSFNFKRV